MFDPNESMGMPMSQPSLRVNPKVMELLQLIFSPDSSDQVMPMMEQSAPVELPMGPPPMEEGMLLRERLSSQNSDKKAKSAKKSPAKSDEKSAKPEKSEKPAEKKEKK